MDLLVVGAGTMGRWFARTVEADVAFADVDLDAAVAAADAVDGTRAVGTGAEAGADGDATFDAVCLAVPIPAVAAAAADYADRATDAICDVTGVMGPAVEATRAVAPDRERLSLHPLFAPENAPGNVAVVRDRRGPTTDALLADVAAANRVFETTPAEHDRAMETVQAAAHAAVLSYALATESVRPEFHTPVSRELADLVATVAGKEPGVYREIQAAFDGADRVADAAGRLAAADGDAFDALYREAATSPFAGGGDGDDGDAGTSRHPDDEVADGGDRP
jgi:prephenate dehydrogenase